MEAAIFSIGNWLEPTALGEPVLLLVKNLTLCLSQPTTKPGLAADEFHDGDLTLEAQVLFMVQSCHQQPLHLSKGLMPR